MWQETTGWCAFRADTSSEACASSAGSLRSESLVLYVFFSLSVSLSLSLSLSISLSPSLSLSLSLSLSPSLSPSLLGAVHPTMAHGEVIPRRAPPPHTAGFANWPVYFRGAD